ncbi:MAG: hypothetical protein CM15mP50_1420 [Rhodobacterales bacterium]|nr:MAG: hypothetical protein CM15mP50_1420 [Rhodobacterales bacterium]
MVLRKSLFVPGPTNVPDVIRKAIDVPMEDHRAPDLPEFILPLLNDVKKFLKPFQGRFLSFPRQGQEPGRPQLLIRLILVIRYLLRDLGNSPIFG